MIETYDVCTARYVPFKLSEIPVSKKRLKKIKESKISSFKQKLVSEGYLVDEKTVFEYRSNFNTVYFDPQDLLIEIRAVRK